MNSTKSFTASSWNADSQVGGLPTTTRQTIVFGALVLILGYRWVSTSRKTVCFVIYYPLHELPSTDHWVKVNVPGVGYPPIPFIGSWIAAFRFMYDPVGLVRQGIEKYNRGMFRIATLQGEYVLVPDREQIAEYIRVSDDVLGMQEAANDVSSVSLSFSDSLQ